MPTKPLVTALACLKDLSTQDMADLIDLLEESLGKQHVRSRRRDKTPLDVARHQAGGNLRAALDASAELDEDDLETLIQVAQLQHETLQPVEGRILRTDPDSGEVKPVAQGTVQTKRIRRKVMNPETKQQEWRWYGPYLYIRTYAGRGGRCKNESHLNNIYLGYPRLAEIFEILPSGCSERQMMRQEILDGYRNSTLDEVCERWLPRHMELLLKYVPTTNEVITEEERRQSDEPQTRLAKQQSAVLHLLPQSTGSG